MAAKRWQVIAGGVVLGLMLIASSFALGYVLGADGTLENVGVTRRNQGLPANQPGIQPGGVQQPGGTGSLQGNQPPLWQTIDELPAAPPDLIGRLQKVNTGLLVIRSDTGVIQVSVDENTQIFDQTGERISVEDLQQGDALGVYGKVTQADGNIFLARYIVRLPPVK